MIIKSQKRQIKTKCFVCGEYIIKGDDVAVVPKENGQLFMVHNKCAEELLE